MPRVKRPRPCIVCGKLTLDRSPPYSTPRCAGEWLACALRRNQGRAYPKTVETIVAKALAAGHPVPPEFLRGRDDDRG